MYCACVQASGVAERQEDADAVLNILRELGEAQRRTPKTVV
jgi:hypothetical protein